MYLNAIIEVVSLLSGGITWIFSYLTKAVPSFRLVIGKLVEWGEILVRISCRKNKIPVGWYVVFTDYQYFVPAEL